MKASTQRDRCPSTSSLNAAPILRLREVAVSFDGRQVLEDVNLDVAKGAITAIVGPSGSGKSTLLSVLNRMTDATANCEVSGSVHFDGDDVLQANIDVRRLRRRIGLVFQKPTPLPLSIAANILLPLKDHGIGDKPARRLLLRKALRDVGLWDEVADRLDQPAMTLSGGQQQRLCIARCLALQPEVLLFDEPCSALDPMAAEVIEDLIKTLRTRHSIVLVTHNLAQARRLADSVGVLWRVTGRSSVIEFGAVADIFERPRDVLTSRYVRGLSG